MNPITSAAHQHDAEQQLHYPTTPPHSALQQVFSSDNHLEPSNLTTSSFLSPSFIASPSGNRDADWNSARLSSGIAIPNSSSQQQQQQQQQQSLTSVSPTFTTNLATISPSSTPLQSNLSAKQHVITTSPILAATSTTLVPSSGSMGHNINHDTTTTTGFTSWPLEEEEDKMERGAHEGKNRDGDDSTVQSTAVLSTGTNEEEDDGILGELSPASSTQVLPAAAPTGEGTNVISVIGTPSTVSTAPSTEDAASLGTDSLDKIGLKLDATLNNMEPFTLHRRAPSWDRSPVSRNLYADTEISASRGEQQQQQQQWLPTQGPSPAQAYAHHQQHQHQQQLHGAWGAPAHTTQSRVASFRTADDTNNKQHGMQHPYAHMAQQPPQPQPPRGQPQPPQQWHQPPRLYGAAGADAQMQQPYPSQQQQGRLHMPPQDAAAHGYRQPGGYNPYSVQQQQQPQQRKPGYPPQHPSLPPSQSPQRSTRAPRSQGPSPHRGVQHAPTGPNVGSSARSASEILKTLLRKKACLYEPDTSRAVALVTWLVGRELALEHGYFSRQQLQAGVHACVAEKIESGTITRTKVNRCMQIILNSCFHYIIPRPDGTEEKGHTFRAIFEREVSDDTGLLRMLPLPWNDLIVNRDIVLLASDGELDGKHQQQEPRSTHASPKGSPTLKPVDQRSPGRGGDQHDGEGGDSKRAVLLCFNENVRAAEDVFRCHNEFIRDSAHSSNLQLTAQEWRIFFGKEAASTPHIWGNVGIPVVAVESPDGSGRKVDVLGQMTPEEAGKFRTTWCAKRYDHDHEFCGMAHVEVNGGWLRRDPNVHWYKDEFCPSIVKTADKRLGPNYYVINECPSGVYCKFAHSHEEMIYHPNRYKSKTCTPILRTGVCRYGDICPNHHPSDSARPSGKKGGDGRNPGSRHGRSSGQSGAGSKNAMALPTGSPILYASPAPVSSFERHLLMPGLQNLFRRQCTVVRAYVRNPQCRCCYSYFGDDAGIDKEAPARPKATRPGLPPSLRM